MPYISKDQVKAIRTQINNSFPTFKFSITRSDFIAIDIQVKSGPFTFGGGGAPIYRDINHFRIEGEGFTPPETKFLQELTGIAESLLGEPHSDGDYGSIPGYYVNISIGRWDKKYLPK